MAAMGDDKPSGADSKTATDSLAKYRAKRSADTSPEPVGAVSTTPSRLYVVHKHAASRLHYDLRIEWNGVLKSWAVPKGPSYDMADKRLAVHVEDHPIEYAEFEGVIPKGNYGAGGMILWDRGEWVELKDWKQGFEKGKLLFELKGYKLHGKWTLVKIKKSEKEWLLIKERDAYVKSPGNQFNEDSILSGLTVEENAQGAKPGAKLVKALESSAAIRKRVDPHDVKVMLAEPHDGAFTRDDWIFELKLDGYRLLASKHGNEVLLLTRNGNDYTIVFPEIVRAIKALPYESCILDGEVVVLDDEGKPSFSRLQRRGRLTSPPDVHRATVELPATFYAFDLIAFEDFDLRQMPLIERRAHLMEVVPKLGPVRSLEHIEREGEAFLQAASQLGLEGIIAKKADSRYFAGRSQYWLKMKAEQTGDFVIVGFTKAKGSRSHLGALQLADRVDGQLVYVGRAGTGMDEAMLREIGERLTPIIRKTPPCLGVVAKPGKAPLASSAIPETKTTTWVEPRYVVEVRYREITPDGLLRHPAFLRLRDDKRPEECERQGWGASQEEERDGAEQRGTAKQKKQVLRYAQDDTNRQDDTHRYDDTNRQDNTHRHDDTNRPGDTTGEDAITDRVDTNDGAIPSAGVVLSPSLRVGVNPAKDLLLPPADPPRTINISNPKKIYWPADKYTKGDLIEYYRAASKWILPYLTNRPLVLTRFPDGIDGKQFYQKDAPEFTPDWIRTHEIWSEDTQRMIRYIVCDDEDTLLFVANLGSIPLHIWASSVGSLEQCDWCVIDLDPKDAPFSDVIRCAQVLHKLCEQIGLPNYVKTTGKTGLHIMLPLGRQFTYEQSRTIGELLARVSLKEVHSIATITRQVTRRGEKVYFDYLQNRHGQTIVAPFSVRPLPGATVSMPLHWDEVDSSLDPKNFTIKNAIERIERMGSDPNAPVLIEKPDLAAILERLTMVWAETGG